MDTWFFYSPLPPVISGSASPLTDCSIPSGSITVSDASGNSPDIPRTFRLFTESGVLLQSASLEAGNHTFTGLAPGRYRTEISTGCETADAYFIVESPLSAHISGSASACAGQSVTLSASGGVSYLWSTGQTTASIAVAPASAATYSVTVSNGYCTAVASHTLSINPLPAASIQGPGEVCANTDFTLTAGGGVQYAWNTGQTSPSVNGRISAPATYSVTVTDQNGCQNSAAKTVSPFPVPNISGIGRVCQGGGVYLVVTNGGTVFQWSTGATSSAVTVYPATTTDYTVTVTDAHNCTTVLSHRVVVDVPASVQITGPTSICLGDTVTLGGYNGSYAHQWSTGETGLQIRVSPTQNTVYTLTGKDYANHCTGAATHEIIVSPRPDVSVVGPGQICSGQQATLTANNWAGSASGELSYQWSTGAYTPSITVSPTVTQQTTLLYSVTVSNEGCSVVLSKTLTVNPGVTATVTPGQTICAGDSTLLTASGGNTYLWSTGATTGSIWVKPASSTVYSVTVSNSSGCSSTAQTTVSVNTPPLLSIQGPSTLCAGQTATLTASGGSAYTWNTGAATPSITVSPQQTASYTVTSGPVGCSVSRTHTIEVEPLPAGAIQGPARICPGQGATLTASGGASYRWSAGNATGASITVSPAASSTYTVTITNAQGCSVVRTHALQVGIAGSAGNDGPLTCLKNSVKLYAVAPEPGAQLQWRNPSGIVFAQGDTATATQPGIYSLLITAADGCARTVTTQVTEMRTAPQAAISVSGPLSCAQPSATLSVQTPEPGFSYQWTNSVGALLASASSVAVSTPGVYTLRATGASGCSAEFSATVHVDSVGAAAPDLTVLTDTLTCVKTSVMLRAFSATPGVTFQWKNQAGSIIGTTGFITVNAPGNYSVTAVSPGGCAFTTKSAAVSRIQSTPSASITLQNGGYFDACTWTTLTGNVVQGASYEWRNTNGRVVSTDRVFSTGIAGTYTLKVTSPQGCTNTASATVRQRGVLTYGYNWSTGSLFSYYRDLDFSINGNTEDSQQYSLNCSWGNWQPVRLNLATSFEDEGISWSLSRDGYGFNEYASGQNAYFDISEPGTYFLSVVTGMGCERTKEIQIIKPAISFSGNLTVCQGQSTAITVNGISPYTWSTGAKTQTLTTGPLMSSAVYSVTVRDYNYCTHIASVTVNVIPNPIANAGSAQTTCPGNEVTLSGSASGGTAPYYFTWSNQTYAPSTRVSPSANTTYTLTVTDSKGCSSSASVAVSVKPPPPAAIQASADAVCAGQSVTLTASGGVSYLWSTGQTTASIAVAPASAATYSVTVTGSNNCSAVVSKTIQVHPPPLVQLQGPGEACPGTQVALQVIAEGGGSAFTYAWNTGASTPGISTAPVAAPALYAVTVANEWGCTQALSKLISPLAAPSVYITGDSAICAGQTAGLAAISNVSASFFWSTGIYQASATQALLPVAPGDGPQTYSVTAVAANGCRDSASWSLQVHPAPAPAIFVKAPTCFGQPARLSAEGGAAYRWSTGETAASISPVPLQESRYSVTATSPEGCSAAAEVRIAPPPPLTLTYALLHTNDCIPGNVALTPAVQGAQGAVSYGILRNGVPEWNPALTGLSPGAFTLLAADAKGCMDSVGVEINEKRPPVLTPIPDDTLSCVKRSVSPSANASTSGLLFEWITESGTLLSSTGSAQIDFPGTFYLYATDEEGCTAMDTFQIHTLIPLGLAFDTIPATHCDSANAQLKVRVGAPGKWLFRIDPSSPWDSTGVFDRILPGRYQVYVASRDSSCVVDTLIQVPSKETCIELCAGDSLLIGRPDISAWCVKWLPEEGLADPTSPLTWAKPSGNVRYVLYQADDDGNLLDSMAYKITMCPALLVTPARLNLCEQENPTLTAAGGQEPYIWRNESGEIVAEGATFAPAVPGVYTVTQAGESGPASTAVVEVTREIAEGLIGILASDNMLCADSVRLTSLGGARNLSWKSSTGTVLATGNAFEVWEAGTYTLEGTLGAGCVAQAAVSIFPTRFDISINTPSDTMDIGVYRPASGFYHQVNGAGNQTLSLPGPEGKTVRVDINKGCFDCGTVTIELRDSLTADSSQCHRRIQRSWIARNDCGKRSVALQTILVKDLKPPVFVDFPPDSLRIVCGKALPDETPRALDNSGKRLEVQLHSVEMTALGACDTIVTRYWRAVDDCGNDTIRRQILLIQPAPQGLLGPGTPWKCGETYLPDTAVSQILRQTLQAEDVIWISGFPVRLLNVNGSAGIFSGNGLLTLPFGEKAVKVAFSGVQVNEDGKVLAGSMQALRNPKIAPIKCPEPKDVDFCPSYTSVKDSLARELEKEKNGFKDCEWQGAPPVPGMEIDRRYDPYGFDCNGQHISGGTVNELGCTQADMNDPGNSQCFGKVDPFAWLSHKDTLGPVTQEGAVLAETVRDSLEDLVTGILAELIQTYGHDAENKRTECAGIRNEMRIAFSSLGIADSAYVFGSTGQYIKEGMWRAFSSEPKTLNSSIERRQEMIVLEQKHVNLYACDQEQEKRQALYLQVQEWAKEQNKGGLIQALNDLIRRLPADSVQAFADQDRFLAWLKGQIISRTGKKTGMGAPGQGAASGLDGSTALGNAARTSAAVFNSKIKATGISGQTGVEQSNGWTGSAQYSDNPQADRMARIPSLPVGNGAGGFVAVPEPAEYAASTLSGNSLDSADVLLPLTIDNIVEGKSYSIILDNISFDASSGGKLDAFLTLPSPGGKDTLFFQALNVPFTPGGADYSNARLRLACDAPLRLNNIAQLKVLADDQTYVDWDCKGFSRLRIGAEIEFCRNVLVPYDGATLKPLADSIRLKASLETAITNWDGFTMGLTFSHPFGISEDGGFIFRAEDAYIDMSDTQTPAALQFPENYPFADAASRNLWRGFYMKQFAIYLPQELDKNSTPRGVSLNDLIIDDGGVTVSVSVPGPIIPLSEGNLGGWAYSVDSIIVKILRNRFSGAGFGGLLHIPLLSKSETEDITEEDCVRYSATMESAGKYNFTVQPTSTKKIGMWFADLNLKNSSRVAVTYQNGAFVTKAILNGSITVNSGEAGLKVNIPELAFEGLTVSNTAPYFDPGVWDKPKSTAGAGADFNGFSLSVDSIRAAGGALPGLFFRVNMDIGPENGGIAVKGGFRLKGKLDVSTGRQRWLPDGIQVDQVSVVGEVKGIFKVNGFADFFENHAQFGNGFWGGLDAELLLQGLKGAGIKAVALFGATPGPEKAKYFMVDAMGMLPSSTPSPIKGFGGGVWNRMEAQDTSIVLSAFHGNLASFPIGQSLSGIKYVPSASAGLGLKASLRLSMGEGAFDALVSLSAQFQAGGSLSEMRLTGAGTMLKKPGPDGQIDVQHAAIQAGVDLKYSFSNRAFDGQLNVRMDIPNALTAMGEAKIHFSDKKWFIYVGTPQNPIRALLQIPIVGAAGDSLVSARLYLDMGSELPPLASVPSYFRDLGISSAVLSSQGTVGGGFMFGVALDFRMGLKFKPLYASLRAALGADLALVNYGDAVCASTGKPLGINGWYASGQVYAYIQASVGLVFKDKPFPIAELSVGAILQGRMPNPLFARGALGGKYQILGGLIKGKFNLQFTIGKDCGEIIPQQGSEQSLDQNYEIIAALLPEDGARNVVTTTVPVAQFRFPINGALDSYDENGNRVIYLVELDGTPMLTDSAGTVIPAALEISSDGNFLKFLPYDAFAPNSRYTFTVKVKYSKNGTVLGRQEKHVTFITGPEETFIPAGNIASSYPIHQMQHFYPGEFATQQEFIQLVQGQPGLFASGNAPVAVLSDASGAQIWQGPVQYQPHTRRIQFDFPNTLLRNGQCYVLDIRRPANAALRADDSPGQDASGSLTSLSFCVSAFDSFREKAQAFLQAAAPASISDPVLRSAAAEGFDALETGGAFGSQGLVQLEADFWNTQNPPEQWYLQQTERLYKTYTSQYQFSDPFAFTPIARGGGAPATAVYFGSNGSSIRYEVLNEVYADFEDFLNQLHEYEMNLASACLPGQEPAYGSSGACANCCLLPAFLPALKNTGLSLPPAGKYPLRLTYAVPGMNGSSSTEPGLWLQAPNPE